MPHHHRPFDYVAPPGLAAPEPRHPVVIVGAGPIGLAMALELANHGQKSVVVDDNDVVSIGSRAICWSKRSLEIFDRLGIGDRAVEKGVTWQVGRTFRGSKEIFSFDLLPEDGHKRPAFINLQQYHVEEYLVDAARKSGLVDLRFKNKAVAIDLDADGVEIELETPDGHYTLSAEYLIACDGAKSSIREFMGLDFIGRPFEERFLIADIEMEADFPPERRFWFEPEFHPGQSALLHKQPDNIYRIDLQLGWEADPEVEKRPDRVIPRIERVVGHSDFRLDWVSVYSFQCRRLERFVHGRVVFAGDSAHVVSPFGARGGNGGLQDVSNLGWKLAAVLEGRAGPALIDSYDRERVHAADENIANSSRTTRFMTPADGIERVFRDETLRLAERFPFARGWVNGGRLSMPCVYPTGGADDDALPGVSRPGSVAPDAPTREGWLIDRLAGGWTVMAVNAAAPEVDGCRFIVVPAEEPLACRYLGGAPKAVYLIRPDQVIAARWRDAGTETVAAARAAVMEGL